MLSSNDPWQRLRQYTSARIGLGHVGVSLPTASLLAFQQAHAQARDAVYLALDPTAFDAVGQHLDWPMTEVHSQALDRAMYLKRPDRGRRLQNTCREALQGQGAKEGYDIAVVVADGLSALAVHQHAPAMLTRLRAMSVQEGWSLSPVVLAHQGRVAIGDEVGECLNARLIIVMIGERPGLSSPDSLGIYLTYHPHVGCTDAQRNCISNIRPEGLTYPAASATLTYLLRAAFQQHYTGVALKDGTTTASLAPTRTLNQLLRFL